MFSTKRDNRLTNAWVLAIRILNLNLKTLGRGPGFFYVVAVLVTPLAVADLGFLGGRGAQRVPTIFCPKFSKNFM